MQELTIFGIHLMDYTQKESLQLLGEYLNNGGLNTVSYLNTQMLVDSEYEDENKKWLNDLDMTIFAEPEIVKALDGVDASRLKEVGTGFILKSLIHKISKRKLLTYLIADSDVAMSELERELRQLQPALKVGGRFILDREMIEASHVDAMINDINDIVPKVIISRLPYQEQLRLMSDNKKRINGELWLGLLQGVSLKGLKKQGKTKVNSFFYRKIFSKKMNKQGKTKNEQE